ncbi:hypothetical protein GG344DRAFT_75159 [Lentinula edodes]|nr:hypothetical protein GG344DRAFT_75159 [Lentinula edodes]
MSGPISEANFSVWSQPWKMSFQNFKLQKTRRPSSPWMVGPDPWLFHRKLQHQSKVWMSVDVQEVISTVLDNLSHISGWICILLRNDRFVTYLKSLLQINDSRSVGVNVIVGFFWDIDALTVWISLANGGIEKNTGLHQHIDSTHYTHAAGKEKLKLNISNDKKAKRFHDGLDDLFDFAFLEATNKLRYRVDEAEEDRGQSKDDEDALEVEDEDEDLRAGTKNQHGISYANSKEESEDEWDGIWRPEPMGGMSDEDTSQVPEFCVPSSASGA